MTARVREARAQGLLHALHPHLPATRDVHVALLARALRSAGHPGRGSRDHVLCPFEQVVLSRGRRG